MIELLWPWALAALPLPYLIYRLMPPATRQEAALQVPFYPQATSFEGSHISSARHLLIKKILMVIGWLCLVLAASHPRWIGDPVTLPTSGRDLMLSVDISGSMETQDMTMKRRRTTRLRVVKKVVGDFVERRTGDRLGLILFGERPYLQTPLTFDRNTVRALLEEAEIGIAGPRTAIGYAIGLGVKHLQSRPENNRVFILLTDGVNTVGDISPMQAARLAVQKNIRIYTIGFGADEMLDSRGIFSRRVNPSVELDEESLTEIASMTGGKYYRARNLSELAGVYRDLDQQEPIEQESETYRPVRSLFYWPLSLAVAISLLLAIFNPLIISAVQMALHNLRSLLRQSTSGTVGRPE
jgi:Ca-activated chloride channel family protein|tara:strand:+ start:1317 stop:2378 length:1062 start_codon:yes stop_codon:yes gene_type:complete